MRKICSLMLVTVMLCMMFALAAAPVASAENEPENEPENNLVIFKSIETKDNKTVATVRQLHIKSSVENKSIKLTLVDTKHEDSFVIADDASLQTFDLKSGNVSDGKVASVKLDAFKESALYSNNGDKMVYTIQVQDDIIISACSELMFFAEKELTAAPVSTPTPKYIQCSKCGCWYAEGKDFNNHSCFTAPALVQCPDCLNWYQEGNVFRNHICETYVTYIECPLCFEWFEEGWEFDNHKCGFHDTPTEDYIKCPDCYEWFTVVEYYLHDCPADYFVDFDSDYEDVWVYEEEYYMCYDCGGWYNAAELFSHGC